MLASILLVITFICVCGQRHPSVLQQLNEHHEGSLMPSNQCSTNCNIQSKSSYINYVKSSVEITNLMNLGQEMTLVSVARKKATYLLLRAALMTCQEGDIVETGVYTGGSSAIILKTLIELDECHRKFWVFDSFEGLPEVGDKDLPTDRRNPFNASLELFTSNLKSVGVWDENKIMISKGWFNSTIPVSPVRSIVFLRLDGDLYVSTKDAMEGLYPKLIKGGYIYIDDYSSFVGCKTAIDEYRAKHSISDKMHRVVEADGFRHEAVWWRKGG